MSDTCFNCGQKLPRRVACPKRIMGQTADELEDWLYDTDSWQSVEDVLLDAADTSRFNFSPLADIEIDWVWDRLDIGTKVGIRKALANHLRFERKRMLNVSRFITAMQKVEFVDKEAS